MPFVPASAPVKGHQAVDPLSILLGSAPVQSTEVCKRGLQMEPSEVTAALWWCTFPTPCDFSTTPWMVPEEHPWKQSGHLAWGTCLTGVRKTVYARMSTFPYLWKLSQGDYSSLEGGTQGAFQWAGPASKTCNPQAHLFLEWTIQSVILLLPPAIR